jgi:hypothetical protein
MKRFEGHVDSQTGAINIDFLVVCNVPCTMPELQKPIGGRSRLQALLEYARLAFIMYLKVQILTGCDRS